MKSFSVFVYFLQNKSTKRNFIVLSKFFAFLGAMVCLYAALFHALMLFEGHEYSWITGFYWVLTVMSTLGFGDIIFHTDLGLFFTLVVLLSGVIFMLILLPFTFVQFFYQPWLEAQQKAQTPRNLPKATEGHIILTSLDPITATLIKKLKKYGYHYVLLEPDLNMAQELHEQGYNVVVGEYDDPETYNRLQLRQARLVVTTNDDLTNTSIAFTIRELTDRVPIVTAADNEHSIDILEFPGNTRVIEFTRMLGHRLAGRTHGTCMGPTLLGSFDSLVFAELPAVETSFIDKTLTQTRLREVTGLTVVGLWKRGQILPPMPQAIITPSTVLILAGTEAQLERYEKLFNKSCQLHTGEPPVLILGGGRVGHAAAETLQEQRIPYTIVEKSSAIVKRHGDNHLQGDAADIKTLRRAGIEEARTVLITTHHDAMNIYLAFYCRQLRPNIQVISRAIADRTVPKLYRAGADLVMSSASLGANAILSILRPDELSMFTEGLNIFRSPVPSSLAGKSLIKSKIRELSGCTIIAIKSGQEQEVSPDPASKLLKGDEIILIGTTENEAKFLQLYGK